MSKITDETIKQSYKPFDLVTDEHGNIGIIQEVSVNECQDYPNQISYSVHWLIIKKYDKSAWFDQSELDAHCNLFVEIAKMACHPFGNNQHHVKRFFDSNDAKLNEKM